MDTDKLIQQLIEELKKGSASGVQSTRQQLLKQKDVISTLEKLNVELKKTTSLDEKANKIKKSLLSINDREIEQRKLNLDLQTRINKTQKSLIDSFVGLGDASVSGAEKISYYTGAFKDFPLIGSGFDAIGKSLDFNINMFRTLASVGGDFGQSLIRLRTVAREALLPLQEFVNFIGDNASALAALFGGVNQGASAVANLQRNIRNELIPGLSGLGITTNELNEFLGTFFELQRVQGRRDYQNTESSIDAVGRYVLVLDAVTKLTGIQRENLDKLVKQQQADAVFQTFLQGLDKNRATELQTFVAGLQGINPALGDAIKNILATGFPLGEFESMLVGTTDGLMDQILALREGSITIGQFAKGLAGSSDTFLNAFSPQVLRASGAVGEVGNALISFRRQYANLEVQTLAQLGAGDALTKQIGVTQEAFRQFKAQVEGLQTNFLMTVGKGFPAVLDAAAGIAQSTGDFIARAQKDAPLMTASLTAFGMAAKYIYPEAKQIAIIAAGNVAANKISQVGLIGTMKGLSANIGRLALYAGTIVSVIGSLSMAFDNVKTLTDSSASKADKTSSTLSLIGGVLGLALGSFFGPAGSIAGRAMGGAIGSFIGQGIGKMVGGTIADNVPGRAYGGGLEAGQTSFVGERGIELFRPNSAGQVSPMLIKKTATGVESTPLDKIAGPNMAELKGLMTQQNTYYKAFADASTKMERHLNTLVGINAKVEQNTGSSTRKLAKLSPNLV